jgi:hypothetical protein
MTVSLAKAPQVIKVTKETSDLYDYNLDVHRVTPKNAVVCDVPNQGWRTYQEGEYEVIV